MYLLITRLQALLNDLDYNNEQLSRSNPWASPSAWLRDWIGRARKVMTSPAQIKLLNELQYQNDVVSPKSRWASPSPYMTQWSQKMRATLPMTSPSIQQVGD